MDIKKFNNREELREWLFKNHKYEKECWVLSTRSKDVILDQTLRYLDIVEEALCFGWIDSTVKKLVIIN